MADKQSQIVYRKFCKIALAAFLLGQIPHGIHFFVTREKRDQVCKLAELTSKRLIEDQKKGGTKSNNPEVIKSTNDGRDALGISSQEANKVWSEDAEFGLTFLSIKRTISMCNDL
jgi:hypothetical protein